MNHCFSESDQIIKQSTTSHNMTTASPENSAYVVNESKFKIELKNSIFESKHEVKVDLPDELKL